MIKFIVDRQKWYRGKGAQTSELRLGSVYRRDPDRPVPIEDQGKQCCVGFLCKSQGMTDEQIEGRGTLKYLDMEGTPLPQTLQRFLDDAGHHMYHVYGVNDARYDTEAEREDKLTRLFAADGIEVTFVN